MIRLIPLPLAGTSGTNFNKSVAESVSIADSQTAIFGVSKGVAESVSIADSQTAIAAFFRTVSESVSIADTRTAVAAFLASVAEGITISDTYAQAFGRLAAIAETSSIADSQTAIAAFLASIAETAAASDTYSTATVVNYNVSVAEIAVIADAVSVVVGATQPFQGAGNSLRFQHKKKPKKQQIREAVEEAVDRALERNPATMFSGLIKEVARSPEVRALDDVRLEKIRVAVENLMAERDEEDAEALLLLTH